MRFVAGAGIEGVRRKAVIYLLQHPVDPENQRRAVERLQRMYRAKLRGFRCRTDGWIPAKHLLEDPMCRCTSLLSAGGRA